MKEVFEKLPDAKKSKTPPKKKSISTSVETKKNDLNNEDHLVDGFDLGSVQELVLPLPPTKKEENL